MGSITTPRHRELAGGLRRILSKYAEIELLFQIGEYRRGADAEGDQALDKISKVNSFLRQGLEEFSSFDETLAAMERILA
jgi:type III secretion protein N (ATPase)